MSKRMLSSSALAPPKRARHTSVQAEVNTAPFADESHVDPPILKDKIASASAAARVDADPPLAQLERVFETHRKEVRETGKAGGESVVYWMRMEDMRLNDNRALELAASYAKTHTVPLVVLFLLSPGDFEAHDRSSRRVDFTLRNLLSLHASLQSFNVPLHVLTYTGARKAIHLEVVRLCQEWKAGWVCANIEYEVDELRRDMKTIKALGELGVRCDFVHDRCVVEPGRVTTKDGRPYTVYTPFLKNWTGLVSSDPSLLSSSPDLTPQPPPPHSHPFSALLTSPAPIPSSLPGFECPDVERMKDLWPEGEGAAKRTLEAFLKAKVKGYGEDRNRVDCVTSSKLSPYLSAGVISVRECIRQAIAVSGMKTFDTSNRKNGVQMWIQELAWREFYNDILCSFPRVSMGQPFQTKFSAVKWEDSPSSLTAWKDGKTGYPLVDAAMRQLAAEGWMPNRCRMVVGSFLVKDLMIDWREGERHFMQQLIDGDLASNNGGWQWVASTGTDPQPYFRIFHPTTQAEKSDLTGDYIRQWVPELSRLRGKVLCAPSEHMPTHEFAKLGYPRPIVEHKMARERALRRYKAPGCE